ncbi:Delta(24(24(1)))-sterol reductase [Sclerotinia borealis F-4128]|uniref:Delta(24(24(1)))-sterol reductase n=1 Tax=Sclerotinia borealis (strain F-4128) TaxID=1432307 RepID=W9CPM0_SCLBF|nr:Delta(24(24(1)))-sterol reductase [Sclerotinia borealis F-4128]
MAQKSPLNKSALQGKGNAISVKSVKGDTNGHTDDFAKEHMTGGWRPVVCYLFMPGFTCYGKPLLHEGGKQLPYYCSAYSSFYLTIAVMAVLHATGVFPISTILDEFGPILSVAIISGFLMSFYAYFSAFARSAQHRITGYPIYDFFMGAELNPRLFGILDFKMFYEVRIPWFVLIGLSCANATRQYERYGYISGEVMFLVMAHFLYAKACAKAEHLITTTWDMYQEKLGFMLAFWNMAGVPFHIVTARYILPIMIQHYIPGTNMRL